MLLRWPVHMAQRRAWSQQPAQMLIWQSSKAMSYMWYPPTALSPLSTHTPGGVRTTSPQTLPARQLPELPLGFPLVPNISAPTPGLLTPQWLQCSGLVQGRMCQDTQDVIRQAPKSRALGRKAAGAEEGVVLQATRGS